MDKGQIINYLNDNDIYNIEEIEYNESIFPVKIYYEFDDDEILAAKAYAEEETLDEDSEEDLYKPYLNDIARDNMQDIIEDIIDDLDIDAKYLCYDDEVDKGINEFLVVFYEKGRNIDMDEIIEIVF